MNPPTQISLDAETAREVEARRADNETQAEFIKRLLEKTSLTLEEFFRPFDEQGVGFVAIPEMHLANGRLWVVADVPTGAKDPVAEHVRQTAAVVIDDEFYRVELSLADPYTGERHVHRRIPVAVPEDVPVDGPEHISRGIENVRSFVRENQDPTLPGTDTIEFEELVADLAAADASAVTVNEEMWLSTQQIRLRGYMPAAAGYEVCGQYNTVTIDSYEYPLRYDFTLRGLDTLGETPVYVADSWINAEPVTVEEGLDNLRALLEAESHEELRPDS